MTQTQSSLIPVVIPAASFSRQIKIGFLTSGSISWTEEKSEDRRRKSRPIVTLVCRYPAAEATQKVPITTCIVPQNDKSYWLRIRREKWKLRQLYSHPLTTTTIRSLDPRLHHHKTATTIRQQIEYSTISSLKKGSSFNSRSYSDYITPALPPPPVREHVKAVDSWAGRNTFHLLRKTASGY
jgi:hypothetical protein